jgi:hypothetical protein
MPPHTMASLSCLLNRSAPSTVCEGGMSVSESISSLHSGLSSVSAVAPVALGESEAGMTTVEGSGACRGGASFCT